MVWIEKEYDKIPGTYVFDGRRAVTGYPLNKMCFSFNDAKNREEFKRDPDAYCRRYGLTDAQREAVSNLDVLEMLRQGGNIYYLAKLGGIYGLGVQDVGAQQTGMTKEEFEAMLKEQAERS